MLTRMENLKRMVLLLLFLFMAKMKAEVNFHAFLLEFRYALSFLQRS